MNGTNVMLVIELYIFQEHDRFVILEDRINCSPFIQFKMCRPHVTKHLISGKLEKFWQFQEK